MLWLNYFAALALLLSVLAAYISPKTFWPMAFFGISFPVIFALNTVFVIYWGMQMRWWALLSGAMLLFSVNNFFGNVQVNFSEKTPDNKDIKILDYNCMLFDLYNWSHNAQSRKLIFTMLQEESPDIICLQEFYTSEQRGDYNNADTLQKFLKAKNMHAEFTTTLRELDHWGVATFTKYPVVRKGKIIFNTKSNNICIYTDVLINTDTVRIYNLHLASISFGKKEYKFIDDINNKEINDPDLNESKSILKRLKKGFFTRAEQAELISAHMAACKYKIILCGDFNDTPSSFAYHTLSKNLKDAFRQSGSGIGKTYHGTLPFLRIDYILHDKYFSSYNYRRYPESFTDHYPITCYLHLNKVND
ncbi:MAG TPA: endonuclease/exonuclease/phosphatase family protein [Bacteroidia bacterium]|jgi:endonuclease/exonuclease/phosphatase family metal-dependent hydrolase|nr:endonuclease/exonuclease/phosphatase family protein [Bacteroidia bacterium]